MLIARGAPTHHLYLQIGTCWPLTQGMAGVTHTQRYMLYAHVCRFAAVTPETGLTGGRKASADP